MTEPRFSALTRHHRRPNKDRQGDSGRGHRRRQTQEGPREDPRQPSQPKATRAILRTQRRSLQMVLRLLAFNAEHWLADRLNTYLQDNDEYRTTLRNLLHLGGTITYTTNTITVTLDTPTTTTGRVITTV
jgi:hypothetical protein